MHNFCDNLSQNTCIQFISIHLGGGGLYSGGLMNGCSFLFTGDGLITWGVFETSEWVCL